MTAEMIHGRRHGLREFQEAGIRGANASPDWARGHGKVGHGVGAHGRNLMVRLAGARPGPVADNLVLLLGLGDLLAHVSASSRHGG